MKYINEYFGGLASFKKKLADALYDTCLRKSIREDRVDKICKFGRFASPDNPMPQLSDVIADSDKLTARVFSSASLVLGVSLASAIPLSLTATQRDTVKGEMQRLHAGGARAAGENSIASVSLDEQVAIFVQMRALMELRNHIENRG